MKKIFATVAALAIAGLTFGAVATPALADGLVFGGGVMGEYSSDSFGASGGFNGGNGWIDERFSWAGSTSENSASLSFDASTDEGISADFSADSSASAGAGNYIKTQGVGASSTYSASGSAVSGGFDAHVFGGGFYAD